MTAPVADARGRKAPQTRSRRSRPVDPDTHRLLEPAWRSMAGVMIGGAAFVYIDSRTLPGLATAVAMAVAIALVFATPKLMATERRLENAPVVRHAIMFANVGVPMFAYSMALAFWTEASPRIDWADPVALLVIMSTLAAIILKRRLPSAITAQITLWSGVTIFLGDIHTHLTLALGAAVYVYSAIRQSRFDRVSRQRKESLTQAQRRAEQILHEYEQTGQGWFWETDRFGMIVYVSPSLATILGREPADLEGMAFADLFHADNRHCESERTLAFHMTTRSAFHELALCAATGQGDRWWAISGRPHFDSFDNFLGFRGSGHDLTERRRSAENASRLAHYDSLTGLANRFHMAQALEKILNAQRADDRHCSVLLLDLDRFKQVNDTMGHPAGDALLTQVAGRLGHAVGDLGLVGRLGGDEFEIVLPGRHRREDLAEMAQHIIHSLSQPYSIDGMRMSIGASIGIALAPGDGVTSEAVIRNADLALYAAKDGGRGRHHFYSANLHSNAEERRQLEQDLRDAVTNGGLELVYQPVVHSATERITGFEALLRWTHPTKGHLSPAKFIPIAEDAGLIAAIGEWVLRTACADLASWPGQARVAVNVSPLQFANPALPAIVTSALASAGLTADRLELEITESVFLNNDDSTDAMFKALKGVGVRLALDDFGTGYSSLGYLQKAPFDKIKIDQSFVRGMTAEGSPNGAIIASIVSLAEALGMETTAEGVETLDELALIRARGCSHVQGYVYSKPLPADLARRALTSDSAVEAQGPRASRAPRQTVLRKVSLRAGRHQFPVTIRNISRTGAMIESPYDLPDATPVEILPDGQEAIPAVTRWSQDGRVGLEFVEPLSVADDGRVVLQASLSGYTPAVTAKAAARA